MRFFLDPERWTGEIVTLEAAESHHAAAVMRARVGDRAIVFDGAGRSADGVIEAAGKKEVVLRVSAVRQAPSPTGRVVLAVAVPKGSTMEWIVEKAVELGVGEIVPLITRRTVVRLDATERVERQRKWRRVAVEACKQCGQDWLPMVHGPRSPAEALALVPSTEIDLPFIASLEPGARTLAAAVAERRAASAGPLRSAMIWIGPEGDFSPDEYGAVRAAGFRPVTLGSIVLRVETAAFFGASILRYELGRAGIECDSL